MDRCLTTIFAGVLVGVHLMIVSVSLLITPSAEADETPTVISGIVSMSQLGLPPRPIPKKRCRSGTSAGTPDPYRAVVYLEVPDYLKGIRSGNAELVMAQKELQFRPGILPVQVGSTVAFPNLDSEYHNVFSYSKGSRFDLGRYKSGEEAPVRKFTSPGEVKLYCEIHDHMRGAILVLDTPFFVVSETDGRYSLPLYGLPKGSYKLHAWVSDEHHFSKDITFVPGQNVEIDLP